MSQVNVHPKLQSQVTQFPTSTRVSSGGRYVAIKEEASDVCLIGLFIDGDIPLVYKTMSMLNFTHL